MEDRITALAELFRQAGSAHHAAFAHVNGADPDWPQWYADYLADKLPAHLGKTLSNEDLAAALIRLDQSFRAQPPGGDWAQYYARSLLAK